MSKHSRGFQEEGKEQRTTVVGLEKLRTLVRVQSRLEPSSSFFFSFLLFSLIFFLLFLLLLYEQQRSAPQARGQARIKYSNAVLRKIMFILRLIVKRGLRRQTLFVLALYKVCRRDFAWKPRVCIYL